MATGVAAAETQLTPFTLHPGLSISGTARFADGTPVPEGRVGATPIWAKTDVRVGPHRLSWSGGRVLECPAGAPVEPELGLFRVAGLASGDYEVGLSASRISSDLLDKLKRRASPPLEGAEFVVAGARVVVEATCDGRPLRRIRVGVSNDVGGTSDETDDLGVARVLVLPHVRYDVAVSPRGFEPEKRSIVAPGVDEETRVVLSLRRSPAALPLRIPPEDLAEITGAEVRLFLEDVAPQTIPDRTEIVAFASGLSILRPVAGGSYRVVALPRPEGYRLPVETHAFVKSGEYNLVELRFPHGGRLRVAARDADGRAAAATFRVVDPDGRELAAGDADEDVGPLLRPGRRRVEVTPKDGETVVAEAVIVPDETTRLEVEVAAPAK